MTRLTNPSTDTVLDPVISYRNWDDLPDRAKEWNRKTVRDIPTLLENVGLAISEQTGATPCPDQAPNVPMEIKYTPFLGSWRAKAPIASAVAKFYTANDSYTSPSS